MKKVLLVAFFIPVLAVKGQIVGDRSQIPVMVFGTFHFAYPNLDVVKTEKKDQIDVLAIDRQKEIIALSQKLARFKPTKIAIEVKTWMQSGIDSQYTAYLKDSFLLPVGEQYQIGFRLAKLLKHQKVYCIDTWGNIDYFFTTTDNKNFAVRAERKQQMAKYDAFEDSLLKAGKLEVQKADKTGTGKYQTLQSLFAAINQPAKLMQDHSAYFGAMFQFEAEPHDYTGVDWVALSWYSRNLRIFRNIQRISNNSNDRILIIYGSGHAYLLNQFLNESPQHKPISPLLYLTNNKR